LTAHDKLADRYDIIGDVRGEADALQRLWEKLGYAPIDGYWQHSSRQAIFAV
jgi:hypothetical protein